MWSAHSMSLRFCATMPAGLAGCKNSRKANLAVRALSDVMNGADPDPDLTKHVKRIDDRTIHTAAAAAVWGTELSRDGRLLVDARHLAAELAAAAAGDSSALRQRVRSGDGWVLPALLLSRLQMRLVESVCSQIDMHAEHLQPSQSLSTVTARQRLADGGRVTDWMRLLPDHSNDEWLHATSIVTVNGVAKPVVVDAGPDLVSAAWSARVAAPVTVTPAEGPWPVAVVRDALDTHAEPVRQWVASMSRELCDNGNGDLLLRIGHPLRQFLMSPVTATITKMFPTRIGAVSRIGDVIVPLLGNLPAAAHDLVPSDQTKGSTHSDELLSRLRDVPVGCAVGPDTVIDDAIPVHTIARDEMALLSLVPPRDIGIVKLTANLTTYEWEDATELIREIRRTKGITLRAPILGWSDQDPVHGNDHRITLHMLANRGVPVRTRYGYGALLPAGTRLTLVHVKVSRGHATLYAIADMHVASDIAVTSPPPKGSGFSLGRSLATDKTCQLNQQCRIHH